MKILVFATFTSATAARLRLLEQWAEALERIAPDCDHLIVDSQSPVLDTAAHRFLSRFGPRLPCPGEPTPAPVGHRSIIGFAGRADALGKGEGDAWGRSFSQGLLCAISSGYDHVVHIAGDLLTRLDISTICSFMRDHRIDALGTVTPLQGWLEPGLLFLRVEFLRRSRLVEREDWRRGLASRDRGAVLGELLGENLYLQLWRGMMGEAGFLKYRPADLHWVARQKDPTIYDEFMASGVWPARHYGGPVGLDSPAEAAQWYRETAGAIAGTSNRLATMYANGQGVAQDYTEAARLYRRAADQGDASAGNNLGNLYCAGQGVPQDSGEAAKWYRWAAERGDVAGQANLGALYFRGHGVPQSCRDAMAWFRKAAERGNVAAQYNLGVIYATGQGTARNPVAAAMWFRKAAEQGDADAQYILGSAYAQGDGVPQDPVEAHAWLDLAAEQGAVDAATGRGKMAASMSADQIEQARALAAMRKPRTGR